MKRLLNTLYVTNEDAYLTKKGETVCVEIGDSLAGRFPLHTLGSIICFSYKGASPALMGKCAEDGINIAFFSPTGFFLCRAVGKNQGNVLLRKKQYRYSENEELSSKVARNFYIGQSI